MLAVEDVAYAYPRRPLLEHVSFAVAPGEIAAILGPNGAGKSTLLKCLNAILTPARGCVRVNGAALADLSPHAVARRVGYLAQRIETARLTVFDAVMLGRLPHQGLRRSAADEQIVAEALAALDLGGMALRFIDTLSGGELQKVAVARALAQTPQVLLLDEPTAALDLRNQVEIARLLRRVVAERGMAAVMTMHDLNLALRYADRFLFLAEGRIVAQGTAAIVTPELIEAVYGAPVHIARFGEVPVVIPA